MVSVFIPCSFLHSFTILGRIGGDATCSVYNMAPPEMTFQYPRSDRRRCNLSGTSAGRAAAEAFSILGRIGGDATPAGGSRPVRWRRLSVSSVGSEAMQHGENLDLRTEYYPFSILGRIGGDATIASVLPGESHVHLSVSSVGSEAMQPRQPRSPRSSRRTFSILGRIGGDATPNCSTEPRRSSGFQYPRSDRRRCNTEAPVRVGGVVVLSVSSVGSEAMQPPPPVPWPPALRLSVSSVGSEAMQRTHQLRQPGRRDRLSVSSVGSEAMQPA